MGCGSLIPEQWGGAGLGMLTKQRPRGRSPICSDGRAGAFLRYSGHLDSEPVCCPGMSWLGTPSIACPAPRPPTAGSAAAQISLHSGVELGFGPE